MKNAKSTRYLMLVRWESARIAAPEVLHGHGEEHDLFESDRLPGLGQEGSTKNPLSGPPTGVLPFTLATAPSVAWVSQVVADFESCKSIVAAAKQHRGSRPSSVGRPARALPLGPVNVSCILGSLAGLASTSVEPTVSLVASLEYTAVLELIEVFEQCLREDAGLQSDDDEGDGSDDDGDDDPEDDDGGVAENDLQQAGRGDEIGGRWDGHGKGLKEGGGDRLGGAGRDGNADRGSMGYDGAEMDGRSTGERCSPKKFLTLPRGNAQIARLLEWLYALLTRLDALLEPDMEASLRDTLISLTHLRALLGAAGSTELTVANVNVVIAVLQRHFAVARDLDLIEEALRAQWENNN